METIDRCIMSNISISHSGEKIPFEREHRNQNTNKAYSTLHKACILYIKIQGNYC